MEAWLTVQMEVIRSRHFGDVCLGEANRTSYWVNEGCEKSCKCEEKKMLTTWTVEVILSYLWDMMLDEAGRTRSRV